MRAPPGRRGVQTLNATERKAIAVVAVAGSSDVAPLAGFDISVTTVPAPPRGGAPHMTYIESRARTLGEQLRPGATVALESTAYPGITQELLPPILEESSGLRDGVDFLAGFSPERIALGNTRWSFEGLPQMVSGIDPESLHEIGGLVSRTASFRPRLPRPGRGSPRWPN